MKTKVRNFVKENRYLKWIPNSLTLCNSLCGFIAVVYTLTVYEKTGNPMAVFAASAWIILFAMVFDALDGLAARFFNAASMHGIQMDSLADMVTFGMAPAVLSVILTHSLCPDMTRWQNFMTYSLSGVYLGGAALRLATYNVHAMVEHKSSDKFSGLPSPGGAAALCSIILFFKEFSWPQAHLMFIMPFYAAILGLLMVSNIPYPHVGKWIFSIRRNRKRLLCFMAMIIAVAVSPVISVVALVNGYIVGVPVLVWGTRIFKHVTKQQEQ